MTKKNAFYCICVNQQFWYTTVDSSVYIFMNHTGDAHHLTTKVLFLTLCGDHNHNHIWLCFVLGCPQPHPCSSVHRQYLNTYIVSYMYDLWGRRRYVKNPHPWTLTKRHVASQWGWSLSDSCHTACTYIKLQSWISSRNKSLRVDYLGTVYLYIFTYTFLTKYKANNR